MTPRAADVSEVDPGAWVSLPCIRLLVHPTYPGDMVGSPLLPPYPAYTPPTIPDIYTLPPYPACTTPSMSHPWEKRQDYAQRGVPTMGEEAGLCAEGLTTLRRRGTSLRRGLTTLRRRSTSLRRGVNHPKEEEHLSAQQASSLRRRSTSLRNMPLSLPP